MYSLTYKISLYIPYIDIYIWVYTEFRLVQHKAKSVNCLVRIEPTIVAIDLFSTLPE